MKSNKLNFLADLFAALYIVFCFFRSLGSNSGDRQAIIFSRGAFRRDISSIGRGCFLVVIHGEWLRRFLRMGVPDGFLEQVICLSYRRELRMAFPMALRFFRYFANRKSSRIIFGGVDYFEVAIFAEREFYRPGSTIESVFHENYAIDYVKNVNFSLYSKIGDHFVFDRLYTYGPPATRILENYTLEEHGPRPMAMPRLSSMENNEDFSNRLVKIDNQAYGKSILLLAFPGSEYLAPLCFTATLLEFIRLGRETSLCPMVKFKSQRAANSFVKQTSPMDRYVRWIGDGSIEDLVWQAGHTVVFNSISFYEALLGPTIVIIPAYLDAVHDENLLQETPASVYELCGELKSVRFASDVSEIAKIVNSIAGEDFASIALTERGARKALVRRKFYLTEDLISEY